MLKLKIKLIHEEFNRVHNQLDDDDISGKETVKELLNILQDGKTVDILDKANKMKHMMAEDRKLLNPILSSGILGTLFILLAQSSPPLGMGPGTLLLQVTNAFCRESSGLLMRDRAAENTR